MLITLNRRQLNLEQFATARDHYMIPIIAYFRYTVESLFNLQSESTSKPARTNSSRLDELKIVSKSYEMMLTQEITADKKRLRSQSQAGKLAERVVPELVF